MTTILARKRHCVSQKDKGQAIRKLRERFGMPQRVFARLMSISERSLAKYEKEDSYGETIQRQVSSLSRLEAALARVIKPEAIGEWLQKPNRAFDGLKPLEVIERGEIDRLWEMIYDLESGTAS
jgi:DNA-binding transcriptional regulator YiaG